MNIVKNNVPSNQEEVLLGDFFNDPHDLNVVYILTIVRGVPAAINLSTGNTWTSEAKTKEQAVSGLIPMAKNLNIVISKQ